jgi:uncharacterized membrane protein YkoI
MMTPTCRRECPRRWPFPSLIATAVLAALCCAQGIAMAAETAKGSVAVTATAPGGKITKEQATQSALQALPGKVTDVTIEKKRGKTVYVIEIIAEKDGSETDVLVDMVSGVVLGMDR